MLSFLKESFFKKNLSESKLSFESCFSEQDDGGVKCKCPPGFKGDGVNSCEGKRTKHLDVLLDLYR